MINKEIPSWSEILRSLGFTITCCVAITHFIITKEYDKLLFFTALLWSKLA